MCKSYQSTLLVSSPLVAAIGMMLIATPHELHHVFESVEWDTLLFFAALFVMIEAMAEMGLIRWIGDRLSDIIEVSEASRVELPCCVNTRDFLN